MSRDNSDLKTTTGHFLYNAVTFLVSKLFTRIVPKDAGLEHIANLLVLRADANEIVRN